MVGGEGDDQLVWTWCHCWGEGSSVLWLGGRVTTNFEEVGNFGGVDVVPLLGGGSVLWLGGRVTTNFGGVGNFGGVDVVPLLGAIAGCQSLFHMFLLFSGPPIYTEENGNEFCLELLADVTLFSTLITQNLVFAI